MIEKVISLLDEILFVLRSILEAVQDNGVPVVPSEPEAVPVGNPDRYVEITAEKANLHLVESVRPNGVIETKFFDGSDGRHISLTQGEIVGVALPAVRGDSDVKYYQLWGGYAGQAEVYIRKVDTHVV